MIDAPDPLVCFERSARGDRMVAVFNLSDQPVALPPDLLHPGLRVLDGHGFTHERDQHGVILPPHGALFAAESLAAVPVRVLEPAE